MSTRIIVLIQDDTPHAVAMLCIAKIVEKEDTETSGWWTFNTGHEVIKRDRHKDQKSKSYIIRKSTIGALT